MAAGLQLTRLAANRSFTGSRFRFTCITINSSVPSKNLSTSTVVQATAGKHWRTERVVAVGLLALIPAGVVYPNPVIDYSLATLIPLHNHWGFGSVIVDYVPKSLQTVARALLYALSLGTFGGLMYLTYSDVGIGNAVRMIWAV